MQLPFLFLFQSLPAKSKLFVRCSLLEAVGGGLAWGAIAPYVGVLARNHGASDWMLTVLSMAPFLGFIASFLANRLSDRFAWGPLYGTIMILGQICLIGYVIADSASSIIWLFVALQIFAQSVRSVNLSLFKRYVRQKMRPEVLKWTRGITLVISVPAAWLAGLILDLDETYYQWFFPLIGTIAIPFYMVWLGLIDSPKTTHQSNPEKRKLFCPRKEWRVLTTDHQFAWFMAAFFIGTFGEKMIMPITPVLLSDVLHLKYSDIGMAIGIIGPILHISGFFLWAQVLRHWSPYTIVTICMFLKATRPFLWGLTPYVDNPLFLIATGEAIFKLMVSGMEMGSIVAVMMMATKENSNTYMSIHYLLMGVRGIAGPLMGYGYLRMSWPLQYAYWMVGGIVIFGGFVLLHFLYRHPKAKTT